MAGVQQAYFNQNKSQFMRLLHERGDWAIVRARYLLHADMCGPTEFLFGLEKQTSKAKHVQCLKLPGGRRDYDWIATWSVSLFYRKDCCAVTAADELLKNLPWLGEEAALRLERPLSYSQLTHTTRLPGLEGLSGELYEALWSQTCTSSSRSLLQKEVTPWVVARQSCPVPKKGHFDLIHLHTVSLQCADTISSQAVTNRLKTVVGSIVESDQTYCIPNRSIFDNLFLAQDIIIKHSNVS